MRRVYHAAMWALLLTCGVAVGVLMLPFELVMFGCLALLAHDVDWSLPGFTMRQFTDIRFLRSQYPITKRDT